MLPQCKHVFICSKFYLIRRGRRRKERKKKKREEKNKEWKEEEKEQEERGIMGERVGFGEESRMRKKRDGGE